MKKADKTRRIPQVKEANRPYVAKPESDDDDMLPEYDFSKGVRGKYAKRYAEGSNVVVLEPDVAKNFRNSKSVNRALRSLAAALHRKSKRAA